MSRRSSEPVRELLRSVKWSTKVRETQEAIVGAVTGPLPAPRPLLLGRCDTAGRLRYTGRTTTLPQAAGRALAALLAPAGSEHPWTGWTFSAGWDTGGTLDVSLVRPELPDAGRGAGALAQRTQVQDVVLCRRGAGVLRMARPDRRTHARGRASEGPRQWSEDTSAGPCAADERAGPGQVPHHAADLRRFEDPQPRVHLLQTVENLPAEPFGQRQETELVRGRAGDAASKPPPSTPANTAT
jgi:hypothetical protein